jgi:hypothetical protein
MLGRLKEPPLLQRMLLIWSLVQRSSQLLVKRKKIFCTRGTQKLKSEVGVSIELSTRPLRGQWFNAQRRLFFLREAEWLKKSNSPGKPIINFKV